MRTLRRTPSRGHGCPFASSGQPAGWVRQPARLACPVLGEAAHRPPPGKTTPVPDGPPAGVMPERTRQARAVNAGDRGLAGGSGHDARGRRRRFGSGQPAARQDRARLGPRRVSEVQGIGSGANLPERARPPSAAARWRFRRRRSRAREFGHRRSADGRLPRPRYRGFGGGLIGLAESLPGDAASAGDGMFPSGGALGGRAAQIEDRRDIGVSGLLKTFNLNDSPLADPVQGPGWVAWRSASPAPSRRCRTWPG